MAGGLSGCGAVTGREYLAPEKERQDIRSAAVLPLENLTSTRDIGKIVADELATELAARKISVIDRGRSEASLDRIDVVAGGSIDRLAAQRLGEVLGVDAVVYGSVEEAGDGHAEDGPHHADVGIMVRVLDVRTGGYLLAGSYTACAAGDSLTSAAQRAADRVARAVGR